MERPLTVILVGNGKPDIHEFSVRLINCWRPHTGPAISHHVAQCARAGKAPALERAMAMSMIARPSRMGQSSAVLRTFFLQQKVTRKASRGIVLTDVEHEPHTI